MADKLTQGDARFLLGDLPEASVDAIVTSPPYGELKDYDSGAQIGHGQDFATEYVPDMRDILSKLFRVAKPGAALWLVADGYRSQGEGLTPLPFLLTDLAREVGWTLQDVVVWDKGKALPWTHHGKFRNVIEHVLLFSKGATLTRFLVDQVRSLEGLSPYWVRYPERYHPLGKAPSDLWHFPIPNQGSWGSGRDHLCPFPLELVERMLLLTTQEGDVVLDPFAGSGATVAVADFLGRRGIGFELNQEYVDRYARTGRQQMLHELKLRLVAQGDQRVSDLIPLLRILKYPKLVFSGIAHPNRLGVEQAKRHICGFIVRDADINPLAYPGSTVGSANIVAVTKMRDQVAAVREHASAVTAKAPLSKFGLEVQLDVCALEDLDIHETFKDSDEIYVYRAGVFREWRDRISPPEVMGALKKGAGRAKVPPVLASLAVAVGIPVMDT